MTKDINQSDIFKFVSLRPPVSADKKKQEINFITDKRKPEETPVGKLTKKFDPKNGTKIPTQIKEFIQMKEFDLNYLQEDSNLKKIYEFITNIDKNDISNDVLLKGIEKILDEKLVVLYKSEEFQEQLHEIWDRYYAFYMLGRTESINLDNLTGILRIYHLIHLLSQEIIISDEQTLKSIFFAIPLIPKLFTDLPKLKVTIEESKKPEKLDEFKVKEYKNLWSDLVDTNRAIEELKNIRFDTKITTQTKNVVIPNKETGIEEKIKLSFFKNELIVNKKSFETLNKNTKTLLNNINISENNLQISDAFTKLQRKLETTNLAVSGLSDVRFMSYMPEEAKLIPAISSIVSKFGIADSIKFPIIIHPPTNVRSSIKPLGIGDLKVVKQTLKKYVAGEVAHIENVLRGEYKERKHRVLDRIEDIFTISNETSEETTKDLQTTDRFELKKESDETIEEQMSLQAGITVSGSYGMVNITAHGEFAYSKAEKESNKSSSNFAKEVIDKSVSKIQKRTKEERTTKKLHEVEEINTHGIDNKGKPDHVTGIYRWVDKHYEAQVYNYGVRMMFEFIIPEPAAFYEYSLKKARNNKIDPPPKLTIKTPREITRQNYWDLIATYNVQGVSPPPLPWKTISTSIAKDKMPLDGNGQTANSKELIVPAGYISKLGVWFDCSAYFSNYPRLEVTIGNKIFRLLDNNGAVGAVDNNYRSSEPYHWFWEGNPIQISVNSYDVISYTVNAYVAVELTNEAFEQWQIQTFEKILTAYKVLQTEYEQKIAAQEFQGGVTIPGQNPLINREIEKTELKKHCTKMLMDTYLFGNFDAMKDTIGTPPTPIPPDFDIFDALNEGKIIQFFEQAFEWENMTYLFFPYFWGRNSEWINKINTHDADPLFTKFRQAGSSRVVLPVRPAYNDAVMYFLENNGAIWKGGETPRLKDDMFISIAEELRNQTDDLAGAKPDGEPWEVIIPTTLVWLQPDDKLPSFE
ncbi:hypothetical protein C8R34_12248 [Nitrosomonas sp. Nm84]|uniref:hypothetical protein n=1 Tax=Nitrosomonas sp. Nm84 TaxID=200124 RepID=UPI000D769402|nr:hypothetical protein [Nitrosomonas sp. Nm84]PXW85014.1 hypothetical protein C8R34_12248 [Nitrosomonas sp. Nm84]